MKTLLALIGLALGFALSGLASAETRVGGAVDIREPVTTDLYAGGGQVTVTGTVGADAVIVAGTVDLAGDVSGDALLAGGTVTVSGGVGDDLRAAGGSVNVDGFVTDQAAVAGGQIQLAEGSVIGGQAWVSGGSIDVEGQIGGDLTATGGTVTIDGEVAGNVTVRARALRVGPSAVIGGDLIWRGPGQPQIAEDAQIVGDVVLGEGGAVNDGDDALGIEPFMPPEGTGPSGYRFPWAMALTLFLSAALLSLLAGPVIDRAGDRLRRAPSRAMMVGLVALVALPVVAVLLFATLVVWLLAVLVVAGYVFGVLLAGLIGLLAVTDAIVRRGRSPVAVTTSRRLFVLLLVVAAVTLLQAVPLVGFLVTTALVLAGFGTLALALVDARSGEGGAGGVGAPGLEPARK